MKAVLRIFCVGIIAAAVCVAAVRAAGTAYAAPVGVLVVVFAVFLVFQEDRAQRNLQVFERRERLREERARRAA